MHSDPAGPVPAISGGEPLHSSAPRPLPPLDGIAGGHVWGPAPVLGEAHAEATQTGLLLICTVRRQVEDRWSEMMCQAQSGDPTRYATLLLEIGHWLDRDVLGGMDFLERRMLLGFTLASIHEKRCSYVPGESFLGWLVAIVDDHQHHPGQAYGHCMTLA